MIDPIVTTRRPLFVYHPPLVFDRDYCLAVARAGGLPVLDTDGFTDSDVLAHLTALCAETIPFGIRLAVTRTALIREIEKQKMPHLALIVLSYDHAADLDGFRFDHPPCRFLLEVLHIALSDAIKQLSPDGLIVRGCEAPGKVSAYTSFILMQWYLEHSTLPLLVHGGVGRYTAAGLLAAGASGLVLDNQLYLCDEAPLSPSFKTLLAEVTETDTALIGETLDIRYRFFAKLGTRIVKTLKQKESELFGLPDADARLAREINEHLCPLSASVDAPLQSLFYLGQDAASAKSLTRRSTRLEDAVDTLFDTVRDQLGAVDAHDPMVEHSPLARDHGTRYPVIQGPMANISDNPAFARAVYDHGGLPFFAMGNLPADLSETMLAEGSKTVPRFGAGLIGIETFNRTIGTHLDQVRVHKVPFALFAGGIPSQVLELEASGTKTYLHTPNMMMLDNAVSSGCTRFIFEGTEAGGHVGSLTSLVLWEAAMARLSAQDDQALAGQTLIFAGGISTAHASAFISGMTSVLAKRGARIGIQVGSAYLFTDDIVALGSIGPLYQNALTRSRKTILTGSTVGLPSRTVPTPFARKLVEHEHARIKEGLPLSERKTVFEEENLGSLLIGAKGFLPDFQGENGGKPIRFTEEQQFEKGNFLVGDSLAFLDPGLSIETVHRRFFHEKQLLFSRLNRLEASSSKDQRINDDVAVVGMGCVLPDAPNPQALWNNILCDRYSIGDMPGDRLDPALYVDTDRQAEDKSYTKIAGLIRDFRFDHEAFGYTPGQAAKMSRSRQILLTAAMQAAADAGYLNEARTLRPEKAGATGVIVASCLGNERSNDLNLKAYYPEVRAHLDNLASWQSLSDDQQEEVLSALKQGMAYGDPSLDPADGATLHMEALGIARHLNCRGTAYVVDAACATSFAALDCAIRELLTGRHDTMIVAGNNTNLSPEAFIGFGKMGALSAEGSWPFDRRADGFVLGEGCAVFVLKRLKDAVRQNDTIHAVIRGIGSSSDGKGKAIAAPNPTGQRLALDRCFEYTRGRFKPSDIHYIEAHGTSTIMGDQAEIETLKTVYRSNTPIGISSVKSQIGHLLGGAGAAGLLKAILAIKHRTLPPNGRFETASPDCDLTGSALYIITSPRPWEQKDGETRKAAVSSYGFGGINYHVVIEEYLPAGPVLPRTFFDSDRNPDDRRIVVTGLGRVLPDGTAVPMPADRFSMDHYAAETDSVFRLPPIDAGLVNDFSFNNVKYRIPPMAARSIDRAQLFALTAAGAAIDQTGKDTVLAPSNRTAVILSTVPGRRHAENIFRVRAPYLARIIETLVGLDDTAKTALARDLVQSIRARYPKNTEDTVPGFLSNIVSGRIANVFGCNGANFIVDAGDASSAVAVDAAASALACGDADVVITGGVDTNLYPAIMFHYKRLGLLGEKGRRPLMSEGAVVLVMTRLSTAREKNLPILGEYLGGAFAVNHAAGDAALSPDPEGFRSVRTAVDLARTLAAGDDAGYRSTLPCRTSGGLEGRIALAVSRQTVQSEKTPEKRAEAGPRRVVALLSGQGAQYPGMMKDLYDTVPDIKALMDRGEALFRAARGRSLLDLMFGDSPELNLTENTQPAVFLATAALYDHLKGRGFAPDHLIGHSVGEFTALYCAGLLSFDDAMALILTRSSLMKEAADALPGKIMVVFDSARATRDLIRQSGADVFIANKNSLKQTAVSGRADAVEAFCAYLSEKNVTHTVLALSGAFHTPLFAGAAEKLGETLRGLSFNTQGAGRIIANVNARPYPENSSAVIDLLVRQITSPVEFIDSVRQVYGGGNTLFVEIGPNRLLANLLKHMDLGPVTEYAAVNEKKGQKASFAQFTETLQTLALITDAPPPVKRTNAENRDSFHKEETMHTDARDGDDFSSFVRNNEERLKNVLYDEYVKHRKHQAIAAFEKFDFNPGRIVVAGVSVGLPGKGKDVFDPKNFDKLLCGTNFIEPLSSDDKEQMVDKHVTKLHKAPDGNARFMEITGTDDVIQLAGQLGYFDLDAQYGIKKQYDTTIGLSMAAGIEALKDANIPLAIQHKKTSTGTLIPDGWALPEEMQAGTGVILSALWPYSETLIREMTHYFYNKFYVKPYEELEQIYYHLMENLKDGAVKEQITDWFFKIKERRKVYGDYALTRDFAHNITPLGSAHFAQFIRAKGPNIQMSGACASTTQAIGIAEDWIRAGRCERVIVIGGETPTSKAQAPWIGAGFLSLGAASVKKNVEEAAKPFDAKRNGTLLGSGAVSMILEREETVRRRGLRGQAELLGTHLGNTAYHVYNIDVKGISREMNRFVSRMEKRHNLDKSDYTKKMVFMSHETFTPARGGSADAEITALKSTYPDHYRDILISNTKGYTGHTLGAALEDAVLVKVLQTGTAPPIANLTDISDDFKDLRLCTRTSHGDFEYGLHIAAGFGSHLAFAFFKRIEEEKTDNNPHYQAWLQAVTGSERPKLIEVNHTLLAEAGGAKITLTRGLVVDDIPVHNAELPVRESAPTPQAPAPEPVRTASAPPEPPKVVTPPAPSALSLIDQIKAVIAEQTGYTLDMLETDLDLEADLGIDTVKQVEIFGKISAAYNLAVPENLKLRDLNTIAKLAAYLDGKVTPALSAAPAPATIPVVPTAPAPAAPSGGPSLIDAIRRVIAEQTGYDVDMLEADLDLEADLGIDTVKQVEIFGKISAAYDLAVPENLKLRDLNTIARLAAYLDGKVPPALSAAPAPAAVPVVPAAPAPAAPSEGPSLIDEIRRVIAEQTGYETDMLEADLDLEADLGIDTVKQVEIFGKISAAYDLAVPENLKLRDLNTIARLAAYLDGKVAPAVSPAPAAAAIPVVTAAPAAPSGGPSLIDEIRRVIAEQTGYETDMLEADLDLEADLGIDTVKQVEIFGKISAAYDLAVPENLKLRDLNTIARLAAYLDDKITVTAPPVPKESPAPVRPEMTTQTAASDAPIKRLTMSVRRDSRMTAPLNIFRGRTLLLTRDSHGFADRLAQAVTDKGGRVLTLGRQPGCDIRADLTDPLAAAAALEASGRIDEIQGLIHLAPLDDYLGSPRAFDFLSRKPEFKHTVSVALSSFFMLIKTLKDRLDQPGGLIAALSFNSVVFPYEEGFTGAMHPAFAGMAGLLKTVNREYTHARVRLIDIAETRPKQHLKTAIDTFVADLCSDDLRVEKGFRNGEAFVPVLSETPLVREASPIRSGDTLLVTGGAMGITFEMIKALCEQTKVHLIILGRSPIHDLAPSFLMPGVTPATIMAQVKARMTGAKPLEIKKETDRIVRTRDAVVNLRKLEGLALSVRYESVDVSDGKALAQVLKKHKTIDGIIHAAGIEESRFIDKKDLASFTRVTGVKILGLHNLIRAMAGRSYRSLITFSSVTARFGNEGQADYTAANDMIGKMVMKEKQAHPDRRYKVYAWTAWSGAGMAENETVKTVLTSRGVTFLPLADGIRFFLSDLENATDTEVVISGLDRAMDVDGLLTASAGTALSTATPFLDRETARDGNRATFHRTLSLTRDLFLLDHSMEGTPIFLGATGIETMAEAAFRLHGSGALAQVRDFAIPYGIKILKGRPKDIIVSAEKQGDADYACTITSVFKNPKGLVMGEPTLHYQGRFTFDRAVTPAPRITWPTLSPVSFEGPAETLIYNPRRLFMEDLFKTLKDVVSFDGEVLITSFCETGDKPFFSDLPRPAFLTDLVAVDALFQTGGLLEFFTTSTLVLPYKIGTLTIFDRTVRGETYRCLTRKTEGGPETNTYQLDLARPDGTVLIRIEDFQMVKLGTLDEEDRIADRIRITEPEGA